MYRLSSLDGRGLRVTRTAGEGTTRRRATTGTACAPKLITVHAQRLLNESALSDAVQDFSMPMHAAAAC
jgi:hypothetical protein